MSDLGKFKDKQQLLKAYQELEKEFSRRNQKVKEYEDLLGITNKEPLCYLSTLEKLKVTEKSLKLLLDNCPNNCDKLVKYENRWQKLKEWVIKEQGYASMFQEERMQTLDEMKYKIQELESEEN